MMEGVPILRGWMQAACGLSLSLAVAGCTRAPAGSEGEAASSEAGSQGESEASGEGESTEGDGPVPDLLECGGAEVRMESRPVPYMIVVDRSAAALVAWDDDGDPTTSERTPAEIADEIIAAWLDQSGESECSGYWPGLVLAPGASVSDPGPGSACATDFVTIAPGPASTSDLAGMWSSPPLPAGGAPIRAALTRALEVDAEAGDGPTAPIFLLLAEPPGCGDGLDPEQLVDDLLAPVQAPARVVVVRTGPDEGVTPSVADTVPDGVDRGAFFAALATHPSVAAVVAPGDAPTALLDLGACSGQLGRRCFVVASCEIDLTEPPNSPPPSPDAVVDVEVNGVVYPRLDLSPEACAALPTTGAFIMLDEARLQLCGDACASTCNGDLEDPAAVFDLKIDYRCTTPT